MRRTRNSSDAVDKAKPCNVVREKFDCVRRKSRKLESLSENEEAAEDRPNADSDSGDDLFITQKVVPRAVRSTKRRRSTRQSAPKSFIQQNDTESDSSSSTSSSSPSSSDQNKYGDKKRKRKTQKISPLPTYRFPFIMGTKRKPKGTLLTVCRNRSLHKFLIGGFFRCLSKSLHRLKLPTVDAKYKEISPLTEDEEEKADEDIKVVDRKCFAVLSKSKCPQAERAKEHGTWNMEQQVGRSPTFPRQVSAKASVSKVLFDAVHSKGIAVVDMGRNNPLSGRHRNNDSQMEMLKMRCLMPEEKRKQDYTDASPSIASEPNTLHDGTISDVCNTDRPSPRQQFRDEPSNLLPSHPHLICDTNSSAAHSKCGSKKTRKCVGNQEGGTQSPYSQRGQQPATRKQGQITEVEEILPSDTVRAELIEKKRRGPADQEPGPESPSSQEEDLQGVMCEEIPPSDTVSADPTEELRRCGADQEPQSPSSQEECPQGVTCEEVGTTEVEEIPPSGTVRAEPAEKKRRCGADHEQGPESPSSQEEIQQEAMCEEVEIRDVEEIPPSGTVRAEPTEKKRRCSEDYEEGLESPSSQEEIQQEAMCEEAEITDAEEMPPSGTVRAEPTEKKRRGSVDQARKSESPSSQEEIQPGAICEEAEVTDEEEIQPSGSVSADPAEKKRRYSAEQAQRSESPSSQEEGQQGALCEEAEITDVEEIPPSGTVRAESTEKRRKRGGDHERGPSADQAQRSESPSSQEEGQQGALCEEAEITDVEEIPPSGTVRAEPTEKKRRHSADHELGLESPSSQKEIQEKAMCEEEEIRDVEEIQPSIEEEIQQEAMCEEVRTTEVEEILPSGTARAQPKFSHELLVDHCAEGSTTDQEKAPSKPKKKRKKTVVQNRHVEGTDAYGECDVGTAEHSVMSESLDMASDNKKEKKKKKKKMGLQHVEPLSSSSTDLKPQSDDLERQKRKKKSTCENAESADQAASDSNVDPPHRSTGHSQEPGSSTACAQDVSDASDVKRKKRKKKRQDENNANVNEDEETDKTLETNKDGDVELLPKKKRKKRREEVTDSGIWKESNMLSNTPSEKAHEETKENEDVELLPKKKKKKQRDGESASWIPNANGTLSNNNEKPAYENATADDDVELLPKKKKKKRREEATDSWISKESNALPNTPSKISDEKTNEDEDVEPMPKKRKKRREEATHSWISEESNALSNTPSKINDEKTNEDEDVELLPKKKKKKRTDGEFACSISEANGTLSNIAEKPAYENTTADDDVELLPKKKKKKRREEATDSWISKESNALSNTPSKISDEKTNEDEDVEPMPKKRKKRREEATHSWISEESNALSNTPSKINDEKTNEDEDVELLPKKKKKKRTDGEFACSISEANGTLSNIAEKPAYENTTADDDVELLPKKKKKKRREEATDSWISKESNALSNTPSKISDEKTNEDEDVEPLPKKRKKRREEATDSGISEESNALSNTLSKINDEKTNEDEDVELLPKKRKKRREEATDSCISKESIVLSNTPSKTREEKTNEDEDVEPLPKKKKKKRVKETDTWISKVDCTLSNDAGETADKETTVDKDVELTIKKKKKKMRREEDMESLVTKAECTLSNIAGKTADEKTTEEEDVELTTKKKKRKKQRSRDITQDSGVEIGETESVLEKERSTSFPAADTEEKGTLAQTRPDSTQRVRKKKKRKETMEKCQGEAFKEPSVTHRSVLPETAEARRVKRRDKGRAVTPVESACEAGPLQTDEVVVLKKKKKKLLSTSLMILNETNSV